MELYSLYFQAVKYTGGISNSNPMSGFYFGAYIFPVGCIAA